MRKTPIISVIIFTTLSFFMIITTGLAQEKVTIYTYRQPFLLKLLLTTFEKKTGIKSETLFLTTGLSERLEQEGRLSPADLILTVDVTRLDELVEKDLVQAVNSPILKKYIPKELTHPNNLWFAQSLRARVIYASKTRVPKGSISTYQDLANPKWKNQICTRSGKHRYNIGLIAAILAEEGKDKTRQWLKQVKNNLARKPQGNDRNQVKAIYSGECNLSLGNSYYLGVMATNEENPIQKEWAAAVYPITPNQNDSGTNVNISGMALAKHSPNKENAIKLMEFFLSEEAQKIYAEINHEFPVRNNIAVSKFLEQQFGSFKKNISVIQQISKNAKEASKLVDEIKFDF